jgi:glycosyltransferase involved in cell wall biosynthesis
MTSVTVDVAGGPMGGAARFRDELLAYLERTARPDVEVIGRQRRLDPAWLLRRELAGSVRARRVALNNVGFVVPGGERWTLLGNALHFLTDAEVSALDPSLRGIATHQAPVVRLAARRSDVLIAPCSAMAERVVHVLPTVASRLEVRMHPVSPGLIPPPASDPIILCPILFEPYKQMAERITEWLAAVDAHFDPAVRLIVTADQADLPDHVAGNQRIDLVGRLDHAELRKRWSCSRAIYFPPGLESFGFPLAEARASGRPVIARNTAQNREIGGPALCGFTVGHIDSLREAISLALSARPDPDAGPFNPDAYFSWMLGPQP